MLVADLYPNVDLNLFELGNLHGVLGFRASMTMRFALTLCGALTLLMCGCADNGNPEGHSGLVTGLVLTAPTCPVQRVDRECPPRPVPGASVVALDGTAVRGSTLTDSTGAFHLTLPYGRYVIRASNVGGYASTATERVSISGVPVRITLILDSGIR